MSGSVMLRVLTEATKRTLMNRAFVDLYAFYVPYRLVWEDWPEFIAGDDTKTVPTFATGLYGLNTFGAQTEGIPTNQFGTRAYNLIWNRFFRTPETSEVAEDATGSRLCPLRPTSILERAKENIDISEQTIDTSGATITTHDIREAFSQDRFNKIREFYGSKYTDYLAAHGVEASWSILDEPELIMVGQKKLNHSTVESTADSGTANVGDIAGRWSGSVMGKLKRTFAPEHGLIQMFAVTRVIMPVEQNVGPLTHIKTEREQWYSPEFETHRTEQLTALNEAHPTTPQTPVALTFEKYDNLRYGYNVASVLDTAGKSAYFATRSIDNSTDPVAQIRYIDPDDLQPYLQNALGEDSQLTYACTHRLQRLSPLRPTGAIRGVA
jgi:hypothetical protein